MSYFELAKNANVLSAQAQRELVNPARCGDKKAVAALVESNVRLAVNIARKNSRKNIEHDDLVSVAIGSIFECIRTFDPQAGAAFSTHCRARMLADVQAFVRAQHAVSGDTRAKRALWGKVQKLARKGVDLTVDNVSRELDCSADQARDALALLVPAASMSAPVKSDNNSSCFGDTIASKTLRQDIAMERTRKSEKIVVLLAEFCETLSPRDLDIFRSRTLAEFLDKEQVGQQELAQANGISKQRVGQIERALTAKCAEFFKKAGLTA